MNPKPIPLNIAPLQIIDAQCQRAGEWLFAPVSFELDIGQMLVLGGANGSGKTTLIEAIAGLSRFASGRRLFNQSADIDTWLKNHHYLGHKLGNKSSLTCSENLQFASKIHNMPISQHQIDELLAEAGLDGYQYQFASDLSAGQKKRLALSRLLLLKKSFWLLDEPFVNLDSSGCEWFIQVINTHLSQGGSVILTAHDQIRINKMAHQTIELTPAKEPIE